MSQPANDLGPSVSPAATTVWTPADPCDVLRTVAPLRRGRADPAHAVVADGTVWRACWTPAGPGTLRLRCQGSSAVHADAWGPGAAWLIESVPALLGAGHRCEGFVPAHPLLREAALRHPGVGLPRSGLVFDTLVPSVLEQKVTGGEAHLSYRQLVRRFGCRAPGPAPAGLLVPPPAAGWRRVASWEWHRAGVGPQRAATIVRAARVAERLEEAVEMAPPDAERRLRAVPGIGVWTAAEIAQRALGDCDAVSVGDFHVPAVVGWALIGRPVDDDGMLELLEPYRPHRGRVVRLLELSGFRKPRFGPRITVADMRAI